MQINLISRENNVGLSRDVELLKDILTNAGHKTSFLEYNVKTDVPKIKADANIFVELVSLCHFGHADQNIMLPNPEWYDLRWRQCIPKFSAILCKTKSAISAFASLNRNCKYVSFTSIDRLDKSYIKNDHKWLHVAGKSGQKGTDMVYETWANNSHFPHLTILQNPGKAKDRKQLSNMDLVYDHVSEQELLRLQNECGVHICPSETEGFGHYIMEAMSTKAIVVSTDAPPMNELVTSERGILCSWENKQRQRFATNYYVTPLTLSEGVTRIMSMDENQKSNIRDCARRFYEDNDTIFRQLFISAINNLGAQKINTNNGMKRTIGNHFAR